MRRAHLVKAVLITFLCTPHVVFALPDFSRSRISMTPSQAAEGDTVTFTIVVENSGDEEAPYAEVKLELPLEAMFVDAAGLPGAAVNAGEKVMGGTFALRAGESRTFHVRMVVPRDAGGRVLSPDLTVRYLHRGVEFNTSASYDVETRVPSSGPSVGGIRLTPVSLAFLGWLLGFPLVWGALILLMPSGRVRDESGYVPHRAGRSSTAGGAAFMLLLPLGFWIYFAGMAVRDWRSTRMWTRSDCTITDSRLEEQQHTTTSTASGDLRRTRTTTGRSFEPLLALQYAAAGREVVSTGFQTGSHLRIGGRRGAESSLAGWPVGETVPCWFNPADVGDVVVKNGFGGAYLFALFPLPVFVAGVLRTRAMLRRR